MHSKCFVWGPIIIMCCVAFYFIYESYLYTLSENKVSLIAGFFGGKGGGVKVNLLMT